MANIVRSDDIDKYSREYLGAVLLANKSGSDEWRGYIFQRVGSFRQNPKIGGGVIASYRFGGRLRTLDFFPIATINEIKILFGV